MFQVTPFTRLPSRLPNMQFTMSLRGQELLRGEMELMLQFAEYLRAEELDAIWIEPVRH